MSTLSTNLNKKVIGAVVLTTVMITATGPCSARIYANERFGYTVDYPDDFLHSLREADNGDGLRFAPARGVGTAAVFASYRTGDQTSGYFASMELADCDGGHVTLRVVRDDMVATSCQVRSEIVYTKTLLTEDAATTVALRYPVREASAWKGVVARMAGTLTPSTR